MLTTSLTQRLARHPRRVLLFTAAAVLAAMVTAAPVMDVLSNGGFRDPGSESARAGELLESRFAAGEINYLLLVTAPDGVDAPASAAAGRDLAARLAGQPGVTRVVSYWDTPESPLRSRDGTQALILARLGGGEDAAMRTAAALDPLVTGSQGPLAVNAGGESAMNSEGSEWIKKDLVEAESVAVPITVLLLMVVFGSLVAGLLPLAIAIISIMGALAVLRLLALVTDVSVFSVNLTTALGLGLAIDYALFMVSRFREELRRGEEVPAAVRTTVATAGRTVLFSAITVLVSLSALLVFPLAFLRSFAYAGISAVAFAALGAVVVLPAALAVLGRRVDALPVTGLLPRLWRRKPRAEQAGFWHRLAVLVMRRPGLVALGVVAVMLALAAPVFRLSFGLPDDRVMPASASAAQVGAAVRTNFDDRSSDALQIVLRGAGGDPAAIGAYAQRLSRVPGVDLVYGATGTYRTGTPVSAAPAAPGRYLAGTDARLVLHPSVDPSSSAARALVEDVRAVPSPAAETLVAGRAATFTDTMDSLYSSAPWALLVVVVVTAFLLFLFTGGLLVPVKAVVLNSLVIASTLGVLVWVFQEGNLQWLTGTFTETGRIDITMPILMICVVFGLSMDYEVFLLSRIKEEYDRTGDNAAAVALGLERTGRIITAAAGLLAIIFIALLASGFTHIKTLALGTALAVLLDATVVRGMLVPAFMRLAGRANWWAPAPLRRLHTLIGLRHEATRPVGVPPPPLAASGAALVPGTGSAWRPVEQKGPMP
jgi:RND superfamily putative drug exporter